MNALMLVLALINSPAERAPSGEPVKEKYVSIHKGATLKELLAAYGKPADAIEHTDLMGKKSLQVIYRNGVCAEMSCYVVIEEDLVTQFRHVKPEFYL